MYVMARVAMLFSRRYSQLGTIVPSNFPRPWQQSSVTPLWGQAESSLGTHAGPSLGEVPLSAPSQDNYCKLWLTLTSIRHVLAFRGITAWWQPEKMWAHLTEGMKTQLRVASSKTLITEVTAAIQHPEKNVLRTAVESRGLGVEEEFYHLQCVSEVLSSSVSISLKGGCPRAWSKTNII